MGMDLLQNIKSDRVRQRRKQPYRREVFNTVSCMVKGYGLGENFLKLLDQIGDYLSRQGIDWNAVKPKRVFEFPPFSLVSEEEYRLVMTIAGKLDNPYLPFAHSPEEMLLSAPLYEANPALSSEDLLRYDFATLLLCQRAKEALANLKKQSGSIKGMVSPDTGMKEYRGERSPMSVLQDRIKQLETFIARVETTEPQPA
jgi:hypothetical protein